MSKGNLSRKVSAFFFIVFIATRFHAVEVVFATPGDDENEQIFLRAISLLPEERIPAEFQKALSEVSTDKCGTIVLAQARRHFDLLTPRQQTALRPLLERPSNLPESYVRTGGNFRVHYTTSGIDAVSALDADQNGIPDFVEEVEEAFETSLQIETAELGFNLPPDDLGVDGDEYDVYISNLGNGNYGLTAVENNVFGTPQNDFTSYIIIDNDFDGSRYFSKGLAGAQVTAAHELLHGIQFGYRDAFFENEYFYFELCSSWIEDVIYDEINDYYSSVPGYLSRTETPFNTFQRTTSFNYGAAIWYHFVVERFDKINVVRESWESMRDGSTVVEAISRAMQNNGIDFNDAYTEFCVWNYFSGNRANPGSYYEEGAQFPEVSFSSDVILNADITVADSLLSLAYKYYWFTTAEAGNFQFSGTAQTAKPWRFGAIVQPAGDTGSGLVIRVNQGFNFGFLPALSEIIIVPVNLEALNGADPHALESSFTRFNFTLRQVASDGSGAEGITAIYPSPFIVPRHGTVNIEFAPAATEKVEVRILTSGGRVIHEEIFPTASAAGVSSFHWNGSTNDSQVLGSGIYLVELRQGDFVQFKKIAVIYE